MFTMDEVLSKRNQRMALEYMGRKKTSAWNDGMSFQEFKEYLEINFKDIEKELREGTYIPDIVKNYEIINSNGKRRTISNLTILDKFITRLLTQKFKQYLEPIFMDNSYAYQENKGILQAVIKAKEYANAGNTVVVEIDIKNYFDIIPIDRVMALLKEKILVNKMY